jgi:hypothetical protein
MIPLCKPNPTTVPPLMVIDTALSHARIVDFMINKFPLLNSIQKPESLSFCFTEKVLNELIMMIDSKIPIEDLTGIRVYFGTFKKNQTSENDDLIPMGHEDTLMLIFSPTKNSIATNMQDSGFYFFIDHLTQTVREIEYKGGTGSPELWTKAFRENQLPKLSTFIGKDDTKSCWYDIEEVIKLLCYLKDLKSEVVSCVYFLFGSYGEKETVGLAKLPVGKQTTLCLHIATTTVPERTTKPTEERFYFHKIMIFPHVEADTTLPCPPASCEGAILCPEC